MYKRNKLEDIVEFAGEANSHANEINEDLSTLENIDWDEIFIFVPDSDSVKKEILDKLENIRYSLEHIIGD